MKTGFIAMNVLKRTVKGPGLYALEVVGESHYKSNIHSILQSASESELNCSGGLVYDAMSGQRRLSNIAYRTEARLLSEPHNPHDPNAVAVYVSDLAVGYIDRNTAKKLTKQLVRDGFAGMDIRCAAIIVGGYSIRDGSECFGVKLDLVTKRQEKGLRVITPGKELKIVVLEKNKTVHAVAGTQIKFWVPPNSPSTVRVYCQTSLPGEGYLGDLPEEYALPVSRMLESQHQYFSELIEHRDGAWSLSCNFTPKAANEEQEARYREHSNAILAKELSKPYRPKKAYQFRVSAEKGGLRKGNILAISKLPNLLDDPEAFSGPQVVSLRKRNSQELIEALCDQVDSRKLVRLSLVRASLEARVVEVARQQAAKYFPGEESYRMVCSVKLEIEPD